MNKAFSVRSSRLNNLCKLRSTPANSSKFETPISVNISSISGKVILLHEDVGKARGCVIRAHGVVGGAIRSVIKVR